MNCNGTPATPGQDYKSDAFKAPTSSLTVKCAGSVVSATIVSQGGGKYKVEVDALYVFCPGPIEVFDGSTRVYCAPVEPCAKKSARKTAKKKTVKKPKKKASKKIK